MTNGITFMRNVIKAFPPEKQPPYFGHIIAWSDDGTQIVAHARTYDELFAQVELLGLEGGEYSIDSMLADHPVSENEAIWTPPESNHGTAS